MRKTSYEEICSTCKLTNFTDDYIREETWVDSKYTYTCTWFASNDTFMPSTILYVKRV